MALEQEIDARLRQAMRARDLWTADSLRMIKTRVSQRRTAPDFQGVVDDALVREEIVAYRRELQQDLEQYASLGSQGDAHADQLVFEIALCEGLERL